MPAKQDRLQQLIEPSVKALGYQLWGIELLSHDRRSLLRVYIDSEDGINVDDCARVSHQLSGLLDVENPISGEYILEVSSPGTDRPLFTVEQYQQYVGETLKVRTRMPFDGRRNFSGVLKAVENDEVVLHVEDHEFIFPIEAVEKAHILAKL